MKKIFLLITTFILFFVSSCTKSENFLQLGDNYSIILDDETCDIVLTEKTEEYFVLVFSKSNETLPYLIFHNLVGIDAVKINDKFLEYKHYGGILPIHYYVTEFNEEQLTIVFYLEKTCADYKIKLYNGGTAVNLHSNLGDWYMNDSINIDVIS